MKRWFHYILLMLCCQFPLCEIYAQVVEGRVTDKNTSELLSGVSVTVKSLEKQVVEAYAITDNSGCYKFEISHPVGALVIEVSCLGYQKQVMEFDSSVVHYDFSLVPKVFELNEVCVKGEKIAQRGDTITYLGSAFTTAQDRSLEDILKKMPGLSVGDNGAIRYNGRPINRFYIEGMNLLDGKYTLASRNLSADKIASVQVLENHQPIKVLENSEFSDRAALNIRLKKGARSQWLANGDIAVGASPFLWQIRAFSLHIAPGQQGLFSYKGNNTGVDILTELQSLSLDEFVSGRYVPTAASMFNSLFLSSPALSARRSFFNKSHALTLNQLWKLREDTDLRLNVDYTHEKQEQDNFRRVTYFQPDSSDVTFSESSHNNSVLDGLNVKSSFVKNNSSCYLENKSVFSAKWQHVESEIVNQNIINQQQHIPQYVASNQFRMIRTLGKHSFQLSSINQYEWLPQQLDVNVAGEKSDFSSFVQQAGQEIFTSKTSALYGHFLGRWLMNYSCSYDAKRTEIESVLTSNGLFEKGSDGRYTQWEHISSFIPEISLNEDRWKVNLKISFRWGIVKNDMERKERCFLTPSFEVIRKLGGDWNIRASGNYNEKWDEFGQTVSGRMMNYQTFYRFDGVVSFTKSLGANLQLSYRNAIAALFGNISFMYQHARKNNIQERDIEKNYIVLSLLKHNYRTEGYTLSGEINKLFEWKDLNVRLGMNGRKENYSLMQNRVVLPYSVRNMEVCPGIKMNLFHENRLDYELRYLVTKQVAERGESSVFKMLKQSFTLFFVLSPKWNFSFIGEHLYNRFSSDNSQHFFMADAELRCRLLKRVELNATWSNILNKRSYAYSNFTDMSDAYYAYRIRPSEVLVSFNYKF